MIITIKHRPLSPTILYDVDFKEQNMIYTTGLVGMIQSRNHSALPGCRQALFEGRTTMALVLCLPLLKVTGEHKEKYVKTSSNKHNETNI